MADTRALWHISPTHSEIRSEALLAADCLKSMYSLVSCGTEKLVRMGKIPGSLHKNMRVPHQEGGFDFPIKYGYSLVVQEKDGSMSHLLHPHQDSIPAQIERTPCALPPKRATLISNAETALNAIWDADLSQDSNVAVIGGGLVGLLTAKFAQKMANVPVWIDEKSEAKRKKIEALGFTLLEDECDFTHVFHCSASQAGLQKAIDLAGHEGKVIELSWYGNSPVSIYLGGSFHYGRKQIISSQVSHIPLKFALEHDYASRKKLVMELLDNPWYDGLITKEIALEDTPAFFDNLLRYACPEIGVVIKY